MDRRTTIVKPLQLPKDFSQLPVFGAGILDGLPVAEVFPSLASPRICSEEVLTMMVNQQHPTHLSSQIHLPRGQCLRRLDPPNGRASQKGWGISPVALHTQSSKRLSFRCFSWFPIRQRPQGLEVWMPG